MTEILDLSAEEIPLGRRAFFQEQLKHRLHELVLQKFFAVQDSKPDFTRRDLARRIGRKPEQVTRWLGAAGNLTVETVSDLLIGLGAVLDSNVINVESLLRDAELTPPKLKQSEKQPESQMPSVSRDNKPRRDKESDAMGLRP